MVGKTTQPVSRRVPLWTLGLLGCGLLAYIMPGWADHLMYDRRAILAGEVWRVVTGNFVHWSASHLLYDSLALGLAGWMIEGWGYPHFWLLCGLSAIWTGIVLLAFQPALQFYGGLSGVACGAIVYLSLQGLRESVAWRLVCGLVFLLVVGKIIVESTTGRLAVATVDGIPFVPAPLSHVAGAMMALLIWFLHTTGRFHADAVR
jgi:rhomboid family GlyGly-CTERM serine protease